VNLCLPTIFLLVCLPPWFWFSRFVLYASATTDRRQLVSPKARAATGIRPLQSWRAGSCQFVFTFLSLVYKGAFWLNSQRTTKVCFATSVIDSLSLSTIESYGSCMQWNLDEGGGGASNADLSSADLSSVTTLKFKKVWQFLHLDPKPSVIFFGGGSLTVQILPRVFSDSTSFSHFSCLLQRTLRSGSIQLP
jgi:hypothetical protein